MIKITDILESIADAIEASADIQTILKRYEGAVRILQGKLATEEAQVDDKRVTISIASPDAYDMGYIQTRQAPVTVRVDMYDNEIDSDGIREKYTGIINATNLMHYIAEAVSGISQLGNDVLSARVSVDTERWPVITGTAEFSIDWPVGLNQEASL